MVETVPVRIPPLTGERERNAYIYLPKSYSRDPERRYPVMYMFDGHNLFSDGTATYGRSWRMGDFLDREGVDLIVAAPECDHEGDGRLSEYSPVDFTMPGGPRIKGKGMTYMDWLTGEFKPFVDGRYRTLTDREHTAVGGSSMGGLMTIYALSRYGDVFFGGAALSPSLFVYGGDGSLFDGLDGRATLYMDCGGGELKGSEARRGFLAVAERLRAAGVNLTFRIAEGGEHNEESWERAVPYFMEALGFTGKRRRAKD